MMGSGTTGKMAVKYDRRFIGCDISDNYYEIAKRRIYEATLQMRLPLDISQNQEAAL
jgi:DNA modification methylase